MKPFVSILSFFALIYGSLSHSALTIDVYQDGPDVVAQASGTLDLTGQSFAGDAGGNTAAVAGPSGTRNSYIFLGANAASTRYVITTSEAWSTGPVYSADDSSGDPVGVFSGQPDTVQVPGGYTFGNPLSATARWNNTTIAALDLIEGTYVFTWTADSLTLNIGGSGPVVPPATPTRPIPSMPIYALGVMVLGILIVATRRLSRRG